MKRGEKENQAQLFKFLLKCSGSQLSRKFSELFSPKFSYFYYHWCTRAGQRVTKWQNNKSYKNLGSKEKENPIGSGCLESQLSINSRSYQFYQVDELRTALTFFSRSKFTSDLISLNMISNDCIFLLRPNIQSLQIQECV